MTLNQWSPEKASPSQASCAQCGSGCEDGKCGVLLAGCPTFGTLLVFSFTLALWAVFSRIQRKPSHPRGGSPRGTGLVLSNLLDVHLRGASVRSEEHLNGRGISFWEGSLEIWPTPVSFPMRRTSTSLLVSGRTWNSCLTPTLFLQGTEDSTWVGWKTGQSNAD